MQNMILIIENFFWKSLSSLTLTIGGVSTLCDSAVRGDILGELCCCFCVSSVVTLVQYTVPLPSEVFLGP